MKCTVSNAAKVSDDFASVMVIFSFAVEYINFKSVPGRTGRMYVRVR
jgi:hypothetical protein